MNTSDKIKELFDGEEINMHTCIDCGETLPEDLFGTRLGKRNAHCLKCGRERSRKSYQNNLKKNQKKRKEWQEENREKHNIHANNYQKRKKIKKTQKKFQTWRDENYN